MARLEAVQPGETLARQALPRLRSAILEGHYASGEHLGEVPLSRQLGISRGPLREALQHLIREGLVERVPRRGVFVRSFDRGLVRASGNTVLLEFATQAEARMRLARAATRGDRAGARQSLADHRAILTAMVERDLDRAEPLLRQHIAHSVERLSAAPVPG